jgi:hypothetical protein
MDIQQIQDAVEDFRTHHEGTQRAYVLVYVVEFTRGLRAAGIGRHQVVTTGWDSAREAEDWINQARADWHTGDLDYNVIEWVVVPLRFPHESKGLLHVRRQGDSGRTFDVLVDGQTIGEVYPIVGAAWEASTPEDAPSATVFRSATLLGAAYGLLGADGPR